MAGKRTPIDDAAMSAVAQWMGISSVGVYAFGCCAGLAVSWLGLGMLSIFIWWLGVMLGIVAIIAGRIGLGQIRRGVNPPTYQLRYSTGFWSGLAGVLLPILTACFFILLGFLLWVLMMAGWVLMNP